MRDVDVTFLESHRIPAADVSRLVAMIAQLRLDAPAIAAAVAAAATSTAVGVAVVRSMDWKASANKFD